jgi:hypothetical protein
MALITYDDFSGGLDDTSPSDALPVNFAQEFRNFNLIYGSSGKAGIQKRAGSSKLNESEFNSGAAWAALTELRLPTTKFLIGICGDKIAKMDDSDGTWDDISAALTITPNSGNNPFTVTEMNALKIFANGVDPTIKWSGTGNAAVLGGSPPTAKMVLHINNHLCHARDSTNTRRVQFSDLGDPEAYTSTHFFDMSTQPTAIGAINNNLYVFERYKISRFPIIVWPFSREEIAQGVGCVGPRAIVNVDGAALMFMAPTGRVYVYDGSALNDISSGRIENEIKGMNKARMQYVVMDHYSKRRQIWISYSNGSSTTHDRVLIYDYTKGLTSGAWCVFTGFKANVMVSVVEQRSSGEGDETMFTGDYSGFVRQQDTGLGDDETTDNLIDSLWVSGWNDFGDQTIVKNTRFVTLTANEKGIAHTVDFKVGFDGQSGFDVSRSIILSSGSAVFGTAIFGQDVFSGGNLSAFFDEIAGVGKHIKFAISNGGGFGDISILPAGANITNAEILIRKFTIEFIPVGFREKIAV